MKLRVPLLSAAVLLIAVFFLWGNHRAHILGALPWALLLLCPLLHLFMHRGHGGHGSPGSHGAPDEDHATGRAEGEG